MLKSQGAGQDLWVYYRVKNLPKSCETTFCYKGKVIMRFCKYLLLVLE